MPDWLDKLITGGPAVIFAAMWWLERSERKDIMERALVAMIETKSALQTLANLVRPITGGPS